MWLFYVQTEHKSPGPAPRGRKNQREFLFFGSFGGGIIDLITLIAESSSREREKTFSIDLFFFLDTLEKHTT